MHVYRSVGSIGQEFYRYPLSTIAGKAAIETRLRLLDYIYTFIHKTHTDGTPGETRSVTIEYTTRY